MTAIMLDAALTRHGDRAKLILCHHPPHPGHGDPLPWESLSAAESDRLAAMLRPHRVAAILSGHVHVDRVMHWHGIPVIVSMGLHNTVDPLAEQGMILHEGAGFALCHHGPAGLDVTFVPVTPSRQKLGEIGQETLRSFS